MKKSINPRAFEIQRRFFQALDLAIASEKVNGLKGFCEEHKLNRTKYSRIKNALDKPIEESTYKMIDIDALAALCSDFGVSAEWLLLGRGKILKTEKQ
ncbi:MULTISPECIES: hypothetical protein [Bacteroidales]|uniref:hypothetical protein n=1 Tax=Bacteroidales TaxID=171549 RepID=UPI000CEA644E|nr:MULTISPECIES: hypothetical protein [Bacteroidales]THG42404.1 hypothetical protein E5985_09830 [Muribaculaceae bacterium]GFI01122.1 hypothetical protein IMSAGC004_03533 [Bacteroidaceae bacterium]TGY03725.1 hypothetical protein E5354_09545 [Muribaculum sp. NM65_B17]GAY29894.1 hypothetical protein PvtlMGM2_0747 [Prevotella sp. MGM2]GFI35837.1 hypothetical protein IMSAGC014_02358 [Bacteroidaceae bacterium]